MSKDSDKDSYQVGTIVECVTDMLNGRGDPGWPKLGSKHRVVKIHKGPSTEEGKEALEFARQFSMMFGLQSEYEATEMVDLQCLETGVIVEDWALPAPGHFRIIDQDPVEGNA